MTRPSQSSLWDHIVAGKPLVPAAAFFGFAMSCVNLTVTQPQRSHQHQPLSSSSALLAGGPLEFSSPLVVVTDVAITAPCLLPGPASKGEEHYDGQLLLWCSVSLSDGYIRVGSVIESEERVERPVHLTAKSGTTRMSSALSSSNFRQAQAASAAGQAGSKTHPASSILSQLKGLRFPCFQPYHPLLLPTSAAAIGSVVDPIAKVTDPGSCPSIHPAELDGSLQLGAIVSTSASEPRCTLRVPAALGCFAVMPSEASLGGAPATSGGGGGFHVMAVARPEGSTHDDQIGMGDQVNDNSRLTDHRMVPSSLAGCNGGGMRVAGLLAKPLTSRSLDRLLGAQKQRHPQQRSALAQIPAARSRRRPMVGGTTTSVAASRKRGEGQSLPQVLHGGDDVIDPLSMMYLVQRVAVDPIVSRVDAYIGGSHQPTGFAPEASPHGRNASARISICTSTEAFAAASPVPPAMAMLRGVLSHLAVAQQAASMADVLQDQGQSTVIAAGLLPDTIAAGGTIPAHSGLVSREHLLRPQLLPRPLLRFRTASSSSLLAGSNGSGTGGMQSLVKTINAESLGSMQVKS